MITRSDTICFIVVAHAPLASALREVALHVHPECAADVLAVDVLASWSSEDVARALTTACAARPNQPTLYLLDVAGATPANAVARHLRCHTGPAAAVAGVNVPMLWRAVAYRGEALAAVVERALQGGSIGIGRLAPAD